jgi:cell division protein FtsQ
MLLLTLALIALAGIGGLAVNGFFSSVAASARGGMAAALTGAGFTVSSIAISGVERTPLQSIHAAVGVREGDPILSFDPALVRARLLTLPWVSDAIVRRTLPGGVTVTLIEKHPFALWHDGEAIAVVERSGAIITKEGAEAFARLPLLSGKGAPEAAAPLIDALGGQRATSARVRSIEFVSGRRWNLHFAGGVVVQLPEEGWESQLGELERLIVDKGVLEHDIEIIDLRYPDRYIFRLHNGDSRQVPRERPA